MNEIEVLSLKAARGAGLPWGLAQEAGWAVRWLEARELPGAETLARLIENIDLDAGGLPRLETLMPDVDILPWRASGGALPGLMAGIAFLDRAMMIEANGELEMVVVKEPLLFLPFAAAASGVSGHPLEVVWAGNRKLVSGGEIVGAVPLVEDIEAVEYMSVRVVGLMPVAGGPKPGTGGVAVDDSVLARLDAFAARTYVPESEESRQKGAGAGNIDND